MNVRLEVFYSFLVDSGDGGGEGNGDRWVIVRLEVRLKEGVCLGSVPGPVDQDKRRFLMNGSHHYRRHTKVNQVFWMTTNLQCKYGD